MKKIITTILLLLMSGSVVHAQNNDIPEAPFGMSSLEVLSIFNGNFTNRDYNSALPFGRWLLIAHPKTMELPGNATYRADRTFSRMITVYDEISKQQSDPVLREAYIDSAHALFKQVLEIFDENEIDRYRWTFDYGRFLQTQRDIDNNEMLAAEQYMKLYEKDSERLVTEANGYYIQFIVDQFIRNEMREEAIALMAETEPVAGPETLEFYSRMRDRLFSNPEERIEFLKTREQNTETLTEKFELYTRVGDRSNIQRITRKLYDMDPNYVNTIRMADMAANDANYREAIRFLEEAITKTDDNLQKREATLRIADNHLNMDNLRQARDYARRASSIDATWGQPYLKLADIYAQAVSRCAGGSMTREDKVVYYLVLDQLDRARSVDPSTANVVQRQYRTYQGVVPSAEEKFFMSWNVGDRIRVDSTLRECYGWISETTTVR